MSPFPRIHTECLASNRCIEGMVYTLWQMACSRRYPSRLRDFNNCVRQGFLRHLPNSRTYRDQRSCHSFFAWGVSSTVCPSCVDYLCTLPWNADCPLRCHHVAIASPTQTGDALTSHDPPCSRVRCIQHSCPHVSYVSYSAVAEVYFISHPSVCPPLWYIWR